MDNITSSSVPSTATPVRYRLSGQLGKSPLVLLVAAMVVFALPSYVYGMFTMHIPYVKAKILLTGLLGAGLAAAVIWIARKLHCRSVFFSSVAVLLGCAAGVYVGVAAYMESLLATVKNPALQFQAFVRDPSHWWSTLNAIAGSGMFTRHNRPLSAWEMWVDWGFELSCFLGLAVTVGWLGLVSKPYCEECRQWLELQKATLRFGLAPNDAILKRLKSGDISAMLELPVVDSLKIVPAFLRLDYVLCKTCGNMGTYRIVSVGTGQNGKEENISKLMLMTPETMPVLASLLAREKTEGETPPAPADKGAA
jgi:hypothetical protein